MKNFLKTTAIFLLSLVTLTSCSPDDSGVETKPVEYTYLAVNNTSTEATVVTTREDGIFYVEVSNIQFEYDKIENVEFVFIGQTPMGQTVIVNEYASSFEQEMVDGVLKIKITDENINNNMGLHYPSGTFTVTFRLPSPGDDSADGLEDND